MGRRSYEKDTSFSTGKLLVLLAFIVLSIIGEFDKKTEHSRQVSRNSTSTTRLREPELTVSMQSDEYILSNFAGGSAANIYDRQSGRTLLHIICKLNRHELLEKLLAQGTNPDPRDNLSATPLLEALRAKSHESADVLLKYKADVLATNVRNYSILHAAADNGHYEAAKAALRAGAPINAKASNDFTPLHFACFRGDLRLTVLLCENGADIHISGQGWNPGDLAFGKSEEIVSYIASKKGSFSKSYLIKAYNLIDGWPFLSDEAIFSLDGQHPAMLAVREDLPEQLSALDQQMIELDITNKAGTPLLILAIHHRKTSAAAYLANYTKELNTTDANNKNALMHSLERGDKEISRKLISRGTKLDHLDKAGNTALHYAIARCDNDLVAELLDKGADIFAINYLSRGMMHVAAENNNEFVFSLLIANGCDVNQEDIRGNTALHLAAQANNTRILQALLTNGADFAVRNLQGKLAYDLASTQAAKQILHNRFEIEGENPAMRKLPAEVITTSPGL